MKKKRRKTNASKFKIQFATKMQKTKNSNQMIKIIKMIKKAIFFAKIHKLFIYF